MALLSSSLAGEIAIRLLFSPLGSKLLAQSACIVGGLAFPVYSSFKAIELNDKVEQEHWLLYWTAYGCFHATEIFADKLLYWLPGYYHTKLVFLIWLQLPLSDGARHILTNYLRPVMLKYQAALDGIVNGTRCDINNFLRAHLEELKFIKALILKLAQYTFAAARSVYQSLRSTTGNVSGSGTGSSGSVHSVSGHEESSSGPPAIGAVL